MKEAATEDLHPGRVLGALGRPERLRVFAAVVLHGPLDPQAVASSTGLPAAGVPRHLGALQQAGLLRSDEGSWSLVEGALADAARVAAGLRPAVRPEDLGATGEQANVLRGFLVDGRLQRMPVQRSKRLVVLDFVAQRFEPGQRYAESEVNRRLEGLHPDYASLRRALVDEGFLERREGSYWRAGGTFEVG